MNKNSIGIDMLMISVRDRRVCLVDGMVLEDGGPVGFTFCDVYVVR
jgi:hypothetical protein